MQLNATPGPRDLALAAARRYLDHPTPRNRIAAETKALVGGVEAPMPPVKPKPAAPLA